MSQRGRNMNVKQDMINFLAELQYTIQGELETIDTWYKQGKNQLEVDLRSELDLLRLEAQKNLKIAKMYQKYKLLENKTPEEQQFQNTIKQQWPNCPFQQNAKYGPHCTLPFEITFECPHKEKNKLKEVLYSNGYKKLHHPCRLQNETDNTNRG